MSASCLQGGGGVEMKRRSGNEGEGYAITRASKSFLHVWQLGCLSGCNFSASCLVAASEEMGVHIGTLAV